MLALVFICFVAACGHLWATGWLRSRLPWLDPAEASAISICALLCGYSWLIGVTGPWTLVLANPAIFLVLITIAAAVGWMKARVTFDLPKPSLWWAIWVPLALIPLIKSLSPSDMLDWDTMAYHLAVPQWWLRAGRLEHIPFIHQSNFPQIVDHLFMVGISWGESFAKIFTSLFWVVGGLWVFGVARRLFDASRANWCTLAFLGAPLVLWSSGSGYIDVAHGLFAAMGLLYAAESIKSEQPLGLFLLSGFGFGAAIGSKYTGLQVAFVALIIVVVGFVINKRAHALFKPLGAAVALSLLIGAPWMVRNVVNTGNPVFPFFYEQLGGRGWDQWRADVYRNEQQSFGVGRTEKGRTPRAVGAAVLGLGYQPGRFINPGQTEGGGVPMGAVGIALLLAPLAAISLGRSAKGPWPPLLAASLLLLGLFFLLSQQSRYVSALLPIWALMVGAVPFLRPVVALQAAYSFGLLWVVQTSWQWPVAIGIQDHRATQAALVPFAEFAPEVNQTVANGKVALYDEVFGYFLTVNYLWANPGHSQIIPYERLQTSQQLVQSLKDLGITHVYLNLNALSRDKIDILISGQPVPADLAQTMDSDLNAKWFRLVADAMANQDLSVEKQFVRSGRQSVSALLLRVP